MTKRMFLLTLILLICLFMFGCSTSGENSNNSVLDVTQFNKVSKEELMEILGEPVEVEEWNFDSANGNTYPVTTYFYGDDKEYEFLVIDDVVVRLNILREIQFNSEKGLLRTLGVTNFEKTTKIADTGFALRFSPVSEEIAEIWITNIKDKKFDNAKITYDLNYFK